jgi:hypothetical protein
VLKKLWQRFGKWLADRLLYKVTAHCMLCGTQHIWQFAENDERWIWSCIRAAKCKQCGYQALTLSRCQ